MTTYGAIYSAEKNQSLRNSSHCFSSFSCLLTIYCSFSTWICCRLH